MKSKKKTIFVVIGLLILVIIFFILIINNKESKSITTSTKIISNKKIGWGIKRADNHKQPDLGSKNKQIIESNNRDCYGK